VGCTPNGDGSFTFRTPQPIELDTGETFINEYSGVFGIWVKPLPAWRISFDTELMSADNSFTRISPRQSQEYRVRSTYKPAPWLNLSGSITTWEAPYAAPRREPYRHEWLSVDSQSYRTVGAAQFILGSACRGLRI